MRKRREASYRTKLTAFFLLTTAITFLIGIYSYMSSQLLMNDMVQLIARTQNLTQLNHDLGRIRFYTEDYLSTRSSDSLQSFYDYSNSITSLQKHLKADSGYTLRGIKFKNLNGMLGHYLSILDQTIIDKRNKKTDHYVLGYQEAEKEYGSLYGYIEDILSSDLTESAQKYQQITKAIDRSTAIHYLLFGITIPLTCLMIVLFSREITKPLSRLASCAQEVTCGNFDVSIKEDHTSGEIRILFQTFQMMTASIRKYIQELQEKQKLERMLDQEKLNNLKMKSDLQEAELRALQSQVNPHFIFNSINIGSKIAMLQGDNATCEYLENFADLFRYNLKGLGYHATLREEIDHVRAYMNLLSVRFGDLIRFRMDVPEDGEMDRFLLPCMTLQPLVENAFIHGTSQNENGGTIELKAEKQNGQISLTVANTGKEIPPDLIRLLLSQKYVRQKDDRRKGHTTGIGVVNVLSRLRLFYRREDVMEIRCENGWTRVILTLPFEGKEREKKEKEENRLESFDCR